MGKIPYNTGDVRVDTNFRQLDERLTSHVHVRADITDWVHTHVKADIIDFAHTHVKAEITDFAHTHSWADVSKSGSNLNEIATRSHTVLSDIGTLSHATIDTYLDQAVKQASGPTFAGVILTNDLAFTLGERHIKFSSAPSGDSSIRILATNLPASPSTGATFQLFSNTHSSYPGQLYIDSGSVANAAIVFRCQGTGVALTERMRIAETGYVGIGVSSPKFLGHIAGRLCIGVPNSSPTDGDIGNSQMTFWLYEAGNQIVFRIRDSGGTMRQAVLAYT